MAIYLTKVKRQELARKTAIAVFGIKASNYQVGKAGKVIDKMIDENTKKYIEFHDKYCSPNSDLIVKDASSFLDTNRGMLYIL